MAGEAPSEGPQRRRLARPRWPVAALLAFLATAVFCHPLLYAAFHGSDYVAIANESLAYRYGHALRRFEGERFLWLPQGYTLGLLQQGIYTVVRPSVPDDASDGATSRAGVDPGELRRSMNRFALATGMLSSAFVYVILLACILDRRLSVLEKTWCWLSLLLSQYAFSEAGLFYALAPDYYQLNIVFVSAAVYLFLRGVHRADRFPGVLGILGRSIFVGAAAANKVSMLPIASIVLLPPLLSSSRHLGRLFGAILASVAGLISTFAVIHLAYYGFDIGAIVGVLPGWLNYVMHPGGESGFFEATLQTRMVSHNYAIAAGFCCVALASGAASVSVCRRKGQQLDMALGAERFRWRAMAMLSLVALLGVGVIAGWAVLRRPAQSTLFESASIVLGIGSAVVGLGGRAGGWHRRIGWGLAVSGFALALVTVDLRGFYHFLRQSRERGDQSWAFHEETMSRGKPVIALIENNQFGPWSVEVLLLKAFSDFPTWDISRGWASLERVSSIRFRTLQSRDRIDEPYPDGVLIAQFRVGDAEPEAPEYAEFEQARARSGVTCERWEFGEGHSAQLCEIPATERHAHAQQEQNPGELDPHSPPAIGASRVESMSSE